MNIAARALEQSSLERHTLLSGLISRRHFYVIILALAVFLSGFMVIYVKDWQRRLLMESQTLTYQEDQMHTDSGKLMLEQSAWTTQSRIERIATTQLNMVTLDPKSIVMVKIDATSDRVNM